MDRFILWFHPLSHHWGYHSFQWDANYDSNKIITHLQSVYITDILSLPDFVFSLQYVCVLYKSHVMNTITLWDRYYPPSFHSRGSWCTKRLSNHFVLIFYFCEKSLPKPSGLKQPFFLMNLWIRSLERSWEGKSIIHTRWASN